jgi:hypothetical protein
MVYLQKQVGRVGPVQDPSLSHPEPEVGRALQAGCPDNFPPGRRSRSAGHHRIRGAKVIRSVQYRRASIKQLFPCLVREGNSRRTSMANLAKQQRGQAFPQQEKENQDGAGDRSNRIQSSQIGLHCPLAAISTNLYSRSPAKDVNRKISYFYFFIHFPSAAVADGPRSRPPSEVVCRVPGGSRKSCWGWGVERISALLLREIKGTGTFMG